MALVWRGAQVKADVRKAVRKGMQVTMGAAVKRAKATVRVDTSALQRSIEVISLHNTSTGPVGLWGSDTPNVDYAAKQEFGPAPGERPFGYTPYMRPSAAAEYPLLPARIRAAYEGRPLPMSPM